jgi:hypothetical protein
MKSKFYAIAVVIVLLLVQMSNSQEPVKNDLSVFGTPVNGKPDTYKFNSKYIVEIGKRPDGQIISIYLRHDESESWNVMLWPAEVRDFFRRVNTVRDIGKPVYEAVVAFRYFADVYENAHVNRWYLYSERDRKSHMRAIRVLLPYKVKGVIASVEGEKPWVKIEIGECEYYSFSKGAKVGDRGEFWVIDAGFTDRNDECIESKVNF